MVMVRFADKTVTDMQESIRPSNGVKRARSDEKTPNA